MPRIRTADVRTQVLVSAQSDELQPAAGTNDLISRAEQRQLPEDARAAVDLIRSRNPGRPVKVAEALRAMGEGLDAALALVNQPSGPGQPLLSREEVRNLVDRAPLAGARVQRAIDLLAGPAAVRLPGADVHAELTTLLNGFSFDGLLGSEGGEPVSAVKVDAQLPSPPSGEDLARALGHDPSTDAGFVERYDAPAATLVKEFLEQQWNASPADVARVGALLRGLADLRVLVVGKDGAPGVGAVHPTYLVGAAADGTLVGFETGVVWT